MNTSSSSSQGQPPNHTPSSANCISCKKPFENNRTINCGKCQRTFHLTCTNVADGDSQPTWHCQKCSFQQPDSPRSVRSSTSNSSKKLGSCKQILELRRLHEETQLEREFIRKKYEILGRAEENDDDAQSISSSIHEWLETQPIAPSHPVSTANEQILDETSYFLLPQQQQRSEVSFSTCPSSSNSQNLNLVYTTATQPIFSIPTAPINEENVQNRSTYSNKTTSVLVPQHNAATVSSSTYPWSSHSQNLNSVNTTATQPIFSIATASINEENIQNESTNFNKTTSVSALHQNAATESSLPCPLFPLTQYPVQRTEMQPIYTANSVSINNHNNPEISNIFNSKTSNYMNSTTKNVSNMLNCPLNSANHLRTSSSSQSCIPNFATPPSFEFRPSTSNSQGNLTHQQINARQTVPKDLPTFTGIPEEWPLFSSTFEWSTNVCGLTDAENLVRLQRALKGEALRSVQHILIHPSCVSAALSTLKLLFGQPEKILNSLKNKIKMLPTVNTNKLHTITSFAVEVKGLETTVRACGLLDELNNSTLLQELVAKMPFYFQLNWGSHKTKLLSNNKQVNLTDFADWIYDVGISASSVDVESNSSASTSAEQLSRRTKNAHVHAHEMQYKKKCMICFEDCYSVEKCPQFLAADRNERWNLVRKHNLCKLCLLRHYGTCNSNIVCKIGECQIKHNSLLHRTTADDECELKDDKNKNKNSALHAAHNGESNKQILFKIIPINIYGENDNCIKTFAFIDEGSSVSLVDEDLCKELNLVGDPEPLCLKWTGNMGRNEESSQRLSITISGPNNKKYSAQVRTVKQLCLPNQSLNYKLISSTFSHLRGLHIEDYAQAIPRVLLGLNNLKLCTPTRVKEGKRNEPIAMCTRLGWLLCGSSNIDKTPQVQHNFHICECGQNNNENLYLLMKKFYSDEMTGIVNTKLLVGKDEQRAIQLLEKYVKQRADGHYETVLLWRYDNFKLPQSYEMAKKRLICLEKSLKKNNELFNIFQKTINEYQEKGYIVKIKTDDVGEQDNNKLWYLPIFPVFNKNKPSKTRIVWDAAAKVNGVSLNSMMLKGPDLLTSLPSILFRFRQRRIAVCGDIEQMFHQIYINEGDCNAQRFLWRSCDDKRQPDVYVMKVMIFGASCAPCVSQYVKNLNASKFKNKYPSAVTAITHDHYVDDFLASTDTPEEAIKLSKDVRYIHSKGGFNIRNWCSNNEDVLKNLNQNIYQNNVCLNIGSGLETEKILGVFWITKDDNITFKLSEYILNSELFSGGKDATKREVLRVLMSIYDPLGLIGNFLMYLKIVLQEIWRSGVGWDEPIRAEQKVKWSNWLTFLPFLRNIKIPRCYLQVLSNYNNVNVQLHTFVDASENGYASVSYLRIFDGKNIVISLVGSKTRVAPLKVISIPRLELMAALIGARFANFIVHNHTIKIRQKFFWSDSRTVLSWIRSDHRKYHQFVAVRVSEILDISDMNEWFWISGKNNVADEATKWAKRPDISDSSRWFNGPAFLKLPEYEWPHNIENLAETDTELKQHNLFIANVEPFFNIERFSRWCRVVRSIAFVIKFYHCIKFKIKNQNDSNLSQEQLRKAEIVILKDAQKRNFYDEIMIIQQGTQLKKSSFIYNLSPYVDDEGVLRVGGRIENANVPQELKCPAILPKYDRVTSLLILHYHHLYQHINHETAINEIRQKYYVPKLRVVFRSVIKACQMCKIKKALPAAPQMARLPRARLASFHAPFTFTGVDFFGPIFVTVNRHKEKRYGALFTCLTIRAIHIEIAHSLSTDSCIMAIRNFMARRGSPKEFYSDNGTNFVGAERELREALEEMDKNEFVRSFTTSHTNWNFNPPSAPHMGGAWERLVRSVKSVFYKIKLERYPNDEALYCMMTEVENMINSRPLTYIPVESENEEALTPNHFLLGNSNGLKPLVSYNDEGIVLKENWLRSQQYAQKFWKRWVTEYLPTLTCRTKWFEKAKPLEVGDLVVVVDPANPRNVWPKGRVIEVYMSNDGQVRKAKVMTTCGILERPAAKLAILDVTQKTE